MARAPGSLTISAPPCSPSCQSPSTAPSGSATIAIRPPSRLSNGSRDTLPPARSTRSAAAAASSTCT